MPSQPDVTSMALFCDFENVALGVRDAKYEKFDIKKVLERLLLKGSIVVKKAYCDWERYKAFKGPMHEANFELIEIPHVRQSGKNSADIRMVVDALDLCYTKAHVDTFVIISGDSDFSPLVSKLRENAKTVIGVGVKNSTSDLLIANCDEFIYYDDLVREQRKRGARKTTAAPAKPTSNGAAKASETAPPPAPAPAAAKTATRGRKRATKGAAGAPAAETSAVPTDAPAPSMPEGEVTASAPRSEAERMHEGLELILQTVEALAGMRTGDEKVWGSMVKQALKRVKPGFNESYYGFRSFNQMLQEAETRGLVALEHDDKSGGYAVRLATTAD